MIWQGREIRRPYQVEKNRRIQGNFLRLYNEMRNLIDHEEWSDLGCMLNVRLTELADGLDTCSKEKKGIKYDS